MAPQVEAARIEELRTAMVGWTARGEVAGLVWAVACGDRVEVDVAGVVDREGGPAVRRDTIFRLSSMTKPVVATLALMLVDEGRLVLDDPVDPLLPELADRRVLAPGATSLDDTVPAERAITLRDVLTFRLGLGMDFTRWEDDIVLHALAELGLGAGPPRPAEPPEPDEWMRRLGTVPLQHQPGARWLYHVGADVLGVLLARATDRPFDALLRERLLEPLGMVDTGFWVPPDKLDRFGACYWADPASGDRGVYDGADGQWSAPPAFPGGGAGLVSTIDDYLAFATMLRRGGEHDGQRLLSSQSVAAMTTNHLTPEQLAPAGPDPSGTLGWGYGVGVELADSPTRGAGAYGWDGGLGTTWANDPARDLTGILLTTELFTSPALPPVCADFWTRTYAASHR